MPFSRNIQSLLPISLRIIFPVVATVTLFVVMTHAFILPSIRQYLMDGKRAMIRELVNTAISHLEDYQQEVDRGEITLEEAQENAIKHIKVLRYGPEGKDYFWINDMHPTMIMHPWLTELDGTDISTFEDPNGKRLFVEMENVVREKGEGYIQYMWQWKDDPERVEPKISFVKGYPEWGWIVGTGVYIDDVYREISSITRQVVKIYLVILGAMIVLSILVIYQGMMIDHEKNVAEEKMRESWRIYSALIENVHDMVFLLDEKGNIRFINSFVENHYNMRLEEVIGIPIIFFWCGGSIQKVEEAIGVVVAFKEEISIDCVCENNFYDLNIVPLLDNGELTGMICVARDITERQKTEAWLRDSEQKLRALSQKVLTLQEEERAGLSRELHDELGQQLTALRWSSDRLAKCVEGDKEKTIINNMAEILEGATGELKRICRGLRPPFIDDLGLTLSLKSLVEDVAGQTGIDIRFEGDEGNDRLIDMEKAVIVYRVIQESLNNMRKHSGASKVRVSMSVKGSVYEIEIADNGKGIERIDYFKGGLGITGMKERAALCGGAIKIETESGIGTTVILSIPLDDG